jgi:hypothetical protein
LVLLVGNSLVPVTVSHDVINLENYQELIVIDYIKVGGVHLYTCRLLDIEGKIESNHLKTGSYVIFKNVLTETKLTYQEYNKYKVEDGYLPEPEPVISLQSILSQI